MVYEKYLEYMGEYKEALQRYIKNIEEKDEENHEIFVDTVDSIKYLISAHNLEIDEDTRKILKKLEGGRRGCK